MRRARRVGGLRTGDREDAVAQVGGDAVGVDRDGQLERAAEAAVAALDPVVLLAGRARSRRDAGERQPAVVHVDLDVLAATARAAPR